MVGLLIAVLLWMYWLDREFLSYLGRCNSRGSAREAKVPGTQLFTFVKGHYC